jgi:hypothetical protein
LQIKTKIVSGHTADSKHVKEEVNGTVILPPLVFPDQNNQNGAASVTKRRMLCNIDTCGQYYKTYIDVITPLSGVIFIKITSEYAASGINYAGKKFYKAQARAQCYKNVFVRNLRMFVISS